MVSNIPSYFIFAVIATILITTSYAVADETLKGFDTEFKTDEITADKKANFFVGSRYGRSSPKTRRLNVAPRNDRFFLGSRYGKRSDELMSPMLFDDQQQDSPVMGGGGGVGGSMQQHPLTPMSCIYTGFKNYYRCSNINDISNFLDKLTKLDTEV